MKITCHFDRNKQSVTLEDLDPLEKALFGEMCLRSANGSTVQITKIGHSTGEGFDVEIKVNGGK